MATVWLLRHAKAEKDGRGGPTDFSRALTGRGRTQATALGKSLGRDGKKLRSVVRPELVLCSTARRTQETLAAVLSASGLRPEVEMAASIYEATEDDLKYLLTGYPTTQSIMVVGHQPTLGLLREDLLESSERSERPTGVCSLAIVSFPADVIAEIVPGTGRLVTMIDKLA
jgi:phosphohistidine phosphatase